MPTTVDATLATRIAELVEQHRPDLEEIVDAELDRALDLIVAERIAARNGARDISLATPLCSNCGERPRVAGRTICSRCKGRRESQRQRERRAVAATVDSDLPRANDG